jgi:hypothetical protein
MTNGAIWKWKLTGLQDLKSAENFYEAKVTDLTNNLKDLETIVQRKQQNARTIEEGTFVLSALVTLSLSLHLTLTTPLQY